MKGEIKKAIKYLNNVLYYEDNLEYGSRKSINDAIKIINKISQNYIPKERVLTREEIAKVLFNESTYKKEYRQWNNLPRIHKNMFLRLANAPLKAGSIEKVES